MHPPARRFVVLLAIASLLSVAIYIYGFSPSYALVSPHHATPKQQQDSEPATPEAPKEPPKEIKKKYAFATFLGPPTPKPKPKDGDAPSEEEPPPDPMQDPYFISTRLLNYQFKHAEKTRTQIAGRPFLVLALPTVPKEQIKVLETEGATIVPIEPLKLPKGLFDKKFVENSRFRDVLSKLRLWELVQYEKIVYLDADSFLLQNLDELFLDPKMSGMQKTKLPLGERNATKKATLPKEYLMGASADTYGDQTEWEKPGHVNYLCACFMLFAPSLAMFEYYMDVLTIPSDKSPLKNAAYPEQDLLIHVHRQEGPMPYRRIPISWSANDGEMADELALLDGVKSLHVKGWDGAEGGNVANDKWRGEWRKLVDEMNMYYRVLQMHTVNPDERVLD